MFIWDINALFAAALIIVLGIVFIKWMAYTFIKAKGKQGVASSVFRQCHYCGYVYMDYLKRNPCKCTRCLSYHDV